MGKPPSERTHKKRVEASHAGMTPEQISSDKNLRTKQRSAERRAGTRGRATGHASETAVGPRHKARA